MSVTVDQAQRLLVKAYNEGNEYINAETADETEPEDGWGELGWCLRTPQTVGNHTVQTEEQFGGEGQGDKLWAVFSVKTGDETQYFRMSGWYASYDGFNWDGDLEEVKAQEKTIIVWVK